MWNGLLASPRFVLYLLITFVEFASRAPNHKAAITVKATTRAWLWFRLLHWDWDWVWLWLWLSVSVLPRIRGMTAQIDSLGGLDFARLMVYEARALAFGLWLCNSLSCLFTAWRYSVWPVACPTPLLPLTLQNALRLFFIGLKWSNKSSNCFARDRVLGVCMCVYGDFTLASSCNNGLRYFCPCRKRVNLSTRVVLVFCITTKRGSIEVRTNFVILIYCKRKFYAILFQQQ